MPDEYLDNLSASERAAMWRALVEQPDHSPSRLWVVEDDGRVLGFACFGPAGHDESFGELYAMNVDPDWWRRGVGSVLLDQVVRGLAQAGHAEAVLWTGESNARAQAFYERAGWTQDGAMRTQDVLGVVVRELRYTRSLTSQ